MAGIEIWSQETLHKGRRKKPDSLAKGQGKRRRGRKSPGLRAEDRSLRIDGKRGKLALGLRRRDGARFLYIRPREGSYGANVVLVKGDYAKAFDLATAAIEKFGWYNRNCAINPFLVEGKKTCAMEIAEQLNWEVPDRVFISVGDGCCVGGLYKGFRDLLELGLIDKMPKITGVQAEGSSPIYKAITENSERVRFGPADTIADSISVGAPRNWAKALRAIRASEGTAVTVTDDEILSAIPELARSSGVFGEPAGVTGFAGFRKMALAGEIAPDETVTVVVTGNGLKDIESAKRSVGQALSCAPDIDEFSRLIDQRRTDK
jgi:threonine synthase